MPSDNANAGEVGCDPKAWALVSVSGSIGWMRGTLVKNDLLNRDLVYDWLWVAGSWDRVGPAAKRYRERTGVPYLYENFEALASGQQ
jgi:hypothetical protein